MSDTTQMSEEFESNPEAKNWAVIAHLCGFLYFFIPAFGGLIATAIVWWLKRDSAPFVRQHARAALNFQITLIIATGIVSVLTYILIGWLFFLPLLAVAAILPMIGAVCASKGSDFRYPLSLRLIS